MTQARRLRLWLVGGSAGLAMGGFTLALILGSHQHENTAANAVLVPVIGLSFVATGLIAWARRPENGTGRLLVGVAIAFFLGAWGVANNSALYTVGQLLSALLLAAFVHLMLAYPSGTLRTRFERTVIASSYVVAVGANLSVLLVDPHPQCMGSCPTNLLYVTRSSTTAGVLEVVWDVAGAVLLGAVVVVLVQHWRAATPAARRNLRWILLSGGGATLLVAISFALDPVSATAKDVSVTLGLLLLATVPYFFLAGLLHRRLARGGVADLLLAVRETATVGEAQTALRRVLRDPELQLAVWRPDRGGYTDAEGDPFAIPASDEGRVATFIESEQGGRLATIVHDHALLEEPELLAGALAAARLALERDRLQVELLARLGELELELERDFIRNVVNASPAFFCVLDVEGALVRFNDAVMRSTGIRDDAAVQGRPFVDVLVAEADRADVARLVAETSPGPHEHRWRTLDGDELVVEWSLRPVEDAQGTPRLLLTGLDVSERTRHEEELRRSRTRIVEAGDAERRRLERNLHDGAQQRLVALSLALRLARSKLDTDPARAGSVLAEASEELALALQELRELARGIHPAMLTERGLGAALESLAERSPVPVELEVEGGERLAENVEAAAFYVASEALANVAKYAHAESVRVVVRGLDGRLLVTVSDDGIGGADPARGSGLSGLVDRVEALGGRLEVASAPGGGTTVQAELPLLTRAVVPADAP